MNISVLYGSCRDTRAGIRLARYLIQKLEERSHTVEFFDAKELNLPILNKRYSDYEEGQAPELLETMHQSFLQTDAFLMVSGEYNHSIQPGLKNMLDHFYAEYKRRPGAIALYSGGAFGGWRSKMHLENVMSALQMPLIPSFLTLPKITTQLDEEAHPLNDQLDDRTSNFLDELEWYAAALKAARDK